MPERVEILEYVPEEDLVKHRGIDLHHLRRYHYAADRIRGLVPGSAPVLDVACGVGYGCEIYRCKHADVHRNQRPLVGADISEGAIVKARAHFPQGICFCLADMRKLCFPCGCFATVTCFEGLEHVQESELALVEMYRVLLPGGLFIASIPREASTNVWHRRCFPTEESIRQLMHPVFGSNYTIGTQMCELRAYPDRDCLDTLDPFDYWVIHGRRA